MVSDILCTLPAELNMIEHEVFNNFSFIVVELCDFCGI